MGFFDLPFEIRNQIYSYVISSDVCTHEVCVEQQPALLLVNRAIHEETKPVWYSSKTTHLSVDAIYVDGEDGDSSREMLYPRAFYMSDVHTRRRVADDAEALKVDTRIQHILIEVDTFIFLDKRLPSLCIPGLSQHPLRSIRQQPFQNHQALNRLTICMDPYHNDHRILMTLIKPSKWEVCERGEVIDYAEMDLRRPFLRHYWSTFLFDERAKGDFIIDWCLCAWEKGWKLQDVKWGTLKSPEDKWYDR